MTVASQSAAEALTRPGRECWLDATYAIRRTPPRYSRPDAVTSTMEAGPSPSGCTNSCRS